MQHKRFKNKAIAVLLFLFGYNNLYPFDGGATCRKHEANQKRVAALRQQDVCFSYASYNRTDSHAYIYLRMPNLREEYFNYPFDISMSRKDKSLPVLIESNSIYLNPQKKEVPFYQASSKYKEELIQSNPFIEKSNCLYFASGSQYRFPVPVRTVDLRIIIYYDIVNDKEFYKNIRFFDEQVKYYQYRSLFFQNFTFEKGKDYELKIEVNPEVTIPDVDEHIPPNLNGFTITLKELPPNTKFAFDGKDDVGKTYEQVKKEFILYDKDAEKGK